MHFFRTSWQARHFERWLLLLLKWLLLTLVILLTLNKLKFLVVILLTLRRSKFLVVIFLTFSRSKKLPTKLLWEKPDACASFFGHGLMSPALHPGFSDLWGSPPALRSTPTLGFFECLGIQFFNSLTCDLRDAMPRKRSLHSHVTWRTPCHARGHRH